MSSVDNLTTSKGKSVGLKHWAVYTGLFAVFFLAFWSVYLSNGSGFIWKDDGFEQQYMFFLLEGEWLRSVLSTVFVDHSFSIPLWSDSIGYGADWIGALGNTIGNPINLISVFAVPDNCEYLLQLTVVITLYLSGAAFLVFCNYLKLDYRSSLVGVFVYVFSGTTLVGYWQIYMLYPLLLVVLVAYGIEKMFREKSPFALTVSMSLCFLCSVNMAYMMTLLLAIYSFVRFFFLDQKKDIWLFLKWFVSILGCVCVAFLAGSILFVQGAWGVLGQDRIGLERYGSPFYSPTYYATIFRGFLESSSVGTQCFYGYAPIALVCVVVLFDRARKKEKSKLFLSILFCLFTVFLCLPLFGKLLNGGAYATNRWVWAYSFLVSMIVVAVLPELAQMGRRAKVGAGAVVFVYAAIVLVYDVKTGASSESYFMLVLLAVCFLCLVCLGESARVYYSCAMVTVLIAVLLMVSLWGKTGYVAQVPFGGAYDKAITASPATLISEEGDDIVYDEAASVPRSRNENAANGLKGMTFYNSYYNSYIDQYHSSVGLSSSFINFSYSGLDSRTALDALAGVNRFVVPSDDKSMLPPLYREKVNNGYRNGREYDVYSADAVIPVASFYSEMLDREEYDSLSLVERQEAMLNAVVLDQRDGSSFFRGLTSGEKLRFVISPEGDSASISNDGRTITTTEKDSKVFLSVDYSAGNELYVCFEGFGFSPKSCDEQGIGVYHALRSLMAKDVPGTTVTAIKKGSAQTQGQFTQLSNASDLYGGKNSWAINLGCSQTAGNGIELVLSEPGTYQFGNFYVYEEDSGKVLDDINHRIYESNSKLEGKWTDANTFECAVREGSGEGYVFFRIPYSEGWSATVDGEPAVVSRANLGFCSVKASSGSQIVMKYEKPLLEESAVLSLLGIAIIVVIAFFSRRKKRD